MRQIHHWAALIFVAAMIVHSARVFFTGAFRKPRETNWLIGVALISLAIIEGLLGYSLPDDLLSGTGFRIAEGVLLGIPVVGTYLSFFLFGGRVPRRRSHPAHLHHARAPAARHLPGAHHRARDARLVSEAHALPRAGAHREELRRLSVLPGLHREGGRVLLHHLRCHHAAVGVRDDQPDLVVRALHADPSDGGLTARLLHGLPGGDPADVPQLGDPCLGLHAVAQRPRSHAGHPRVAVHRHGALSDDRALGDGRQP